jgi:hypothetical protein
VSVIMAVYNGAADLPTSLPSVLGQSFADFELVVVDDGSTDATEEVIRRTGDERIVYHRNASNLGQTTSLNVALRLARGEWIARIDADDRFRPGKLQRQVDYVAAHPEVDVLGTWACRVSATGVPIGWFRPPTEPRDILFHLMQSSPICHVSVLMRRARVLAVGGYDESFRYAADYKLWSDLQASGCLFANLPEILMEYRVDENTFGARTVLDRAGDESATIIRENFARVSGLELTHAEARAIHLRTTPAARLSPEAKALSYIQMLKAARRVYGRPSPRLSLRLFLGAVWSIARTEASTEADAPFDEANRQLVRRHPSARLACWSGVVARRLGGRRLSVLKERLLSLLARGYS